MSYSFLNGHGKPIIRVFDTNNNVLETIAFGFKYGALREYAEDVFKNYVSLSGAKSQEYKYSNLAWDLDLSAFTREDYAKKLKSIIDWNKAGYKMYLYPSADKMSRYFEVIVTSTKYTIEPMPGGSLRPGDKGLAIRFETKNPIYDWKWIYESEVQLLGRGVTITVGQQTLGN